MENTNQIAQRIIRAVNQDTGQVLNEQEFRSLLGSGEIKVADTKFTKQDNTPVTQVTVRDATHEERVAHAKNTEHMRPENAANERKRRVRIAELKRTLTSYTEDFAQVVAGVHVSDIEERKSRFRAAHAELRKLEGKPPRGS